MMTTPEEAEDALGEMRAAERRLATRARWSMPRHLAFAALMAAAVAGIALPTLHQLGLTVALLVSVWLIIRRDRHRDGMFVNGWRAGRTLWVIVPTVILILLLAGTSSYASDIMGVRWVPLAAAAIALPVGFGASLLWEHVYRKELDA